MSKQTAPSPNIRRVETGHGEKVYFVQPKWKEECDEHDKGRHRAPSYRPADGHKPVIESHAGTSRKIIQP